MEAALRAPCPTPTLESQNQEEGGAHGRKNEQKWRKKQGFSETASCGAEKPGLGGGQSLGSPTQPQLTPGLHPRGLAHLQPLRGRVALSGPGIELALLVQPRVVGIPAEGTQAPGPVDARGRDLLVGDDVVLEAQGFGASCQQRGLSPTSGIHSFPGA